MVSILDTLGLFLDMQSAPLTLAFDEHGVLTGYFGNPLQFGIDAADLHGRTADEVLPVLYGLDLRERKQLNMVGLGTGVPADIHIIPHRIGVNVVLVDVSEERSRKQKTQQRLHELELAAEREALRGNHAAEAEKMLMLAHEIRNPLFSISGYCDWIMRSMPEDPAVVEKVSVINANANYLLGLVERLLRRDGVNEPPDLRPTDVRTLGDELRTLFSPQIVQKGIGFNLDHELPSEPLWLDADKLKQVLINIIGNAIKYTETGFVSVSFRYTDGTLSILVEDSGVGIAASEQALVTEPFFRSERTSHLPGVGIGLSVSRAMLQNMGGEMEIRSAENWGTTVLLRIPCQPQDMTRLVVAGDSTPRMPPNEPSDAGRSLLLVDDDADILALLEFYLASAGHRVKTVNPDSLVAIEAAFRTIHPEIVVLDLQIHEDFDGVAIARRLKSQQPTVAVILLTASHDQRLRESLEQSWCDLILFKPVNRAELLEAVARIRV